MAVLMIIHASFSTGEEKASGDFSDKTTIGIVVVVYEYTATSTLYHVRYHHPQLCRIRTYVRNSKTSGGCKRWTKISELAASKSN